MKLLFIDEDEFDYFLGKIKNKHYSGYKKFIDYLEKIFIKSRSFNDRQCNYSNYLRNDNKTKKYFLLIMYQNILIE